MPSLLWVAAASGILQLQLPAPPIPDSLPLPAIAAGPLAPPVFEPLRIVLPDIDSTQRQRPRAYEYSRAYETRLAIHHWASYATIPLFAAEYYLGQKLYNGNTVNSRSTRDAHRVVALGVAGLFGVNTITGAWNLWDARKDPNARLRRYIHAALMIASDAGFVATGASAPGGRARLNGTLGSQERQHRGIAIASMGTALAGYAMMLVWK
jgi:hypothetical protein